MSLALRQNSHTSSSQFTQSLELTPGEVHRLSPSQIREAISTLVGQGKMDLATAISDAALALYPKSEDLLVIASLLCEVQQDWERAEQLLIELVEVQSPHTTAQTWINLARVARCQNHLDDAWVVLDFAATQFPNDLQIQTELASVNKLIEAEKGS